MPIISGEQKTKPTQHGVKDLRSLGLTPSIIFCRSTEPLEEATKNKISDFCHVKPSHVLSVHDVTNVYQVPHLLMHQHLHLLVADCLNMEMQSADLGAWQSMAESIDRFKDTVTIALIGKYTGLQDSYLSVLKSLKHAAIACSTNLDLQWVEATQLEKFDDNGNDKTQSEGYIDAWKKLKTANGVIVPGGFGNR